MTSFKLQLLAFMVASAAAIGYDRGSLTGFSAPTDGEAKYLSNGFSTKSNIKQYSSGGRIDIMSKAAAMSTPPPNLRSLAESECTVETRVLSTCLSRGPGTDIDACLECMDFPLGVHCNSLGDACAAANFCPSCGNCGLELTEALSCFACDSAPVICEESLQCAAESKALRTCLNGNADGSSCPSCIADGLSEENLPCYEDEKDTCNALPGCSSCSGCEEAATNWAACWLGCEDFSCGNLVPTPPDMTPTIVPTKPAADPEPFNPETTDPEPAYPEPTSPNKLPTTPPTEPAVPVNTDAKPSIGGVKWVDANPPISCDQTCSNNGMRAVTSGTNGQGDDFYVCAGVASNDIRRPGFNIATTLRSGGLCLFASNGGLERSSDYTCLCDNGSECTGCDDGNKCTTDQFDEASGECQYIPKRCPGTGVCDPDTGSCMEQAK